MYPTYFLHMEKDDGKKVFIDEIGEFEVVGLPMRIFHWCLTFKFMLFTEILLLANKSKKFGLAECM